MPARIERQGQDRSFEGGARVNRIETLHAMVCFVLEQEPISIAGFLNFVIGLAL